MEEDTTHTETPAEAIETAPEVADARPINSVDATAHQPLVARVQARKLELEMVLESLPATDLTTRSDIGIALATVNDLLTGDLEHVPSVVAVDLNRWLERTKHVAERASVAPAEVVAPPEPLST